ncbi:class I SAM-dependent methyltransferase [Rubrobacter aplysinae]|uniref:class I SAM-dependent methyltransferase n=1 Tax=Rubrobacter aplysinae TaxID=909625 RepID=UPI00064C3EC5|nr:class I SAM-dependent methyltransferase [Rubrobacter aplysinae]
MPERIYERQDERPDAEFYGVPRLVKHIDDRAIAEVTGLYREYLPPEGDVLDLMSSWISHLPEEVTYRRVSGLGMNEEELQANPRLDDYVIHDLNENPTLPYAENEFDAATICVSVDYLTRPVEALRDLGRVVRPDGPLVITFSNRCFPTKAVSEWLRRDDSGRMRLVEEYLEEAGSWTGVRPLDRSPRPPFSDPLYAVVARSGAPAGD